MHFRFPNQETDLEDSTRLETGHVTWYAYYSYLGVIRQRSVIPVVIDTNYNKIIRKAYHKRLKHLKIVREAIDGEK